MGAEEKQGLPVLAFPTRQAWETWLAEHHQTSPGVWLKIAKKGSGIETVSYDEAVDGALCHGWIDGQKAAGDERHWLQRFSRRTPRSRWSQINRERATRLIEQRAMQPAGLREVERAKEDGRWDAAYAGQRTMTVPDDLRRALEEDDVAREFFDTLDRTNRYAILYRIHEAKRPETRARRIAKYVGMLRERRKLHP
ncbi:MAG: YdeI/OmpD-associated family protein [Actinomycetota bacterium]|nr:YdeI/OmpD-associated family protein [Actinomycetota bacterium]